MKDGNCSVDELIEMLRNWESAFYSDSETEWLMHKAADTIQFYIDTIHYIEEQRKQGDNA